MSVNQTLTKLELGPTQPQLLCNYFSVKYIWRDKFLLSNFNHIFSCEGRWGGCVNHQKVLHQQIGRGGGCQCVRTMLLQEGVGQNFITCCRNTWTLSKVLLENTWLTKNMQRFFSRSPENLWIMFQNTDDDINLSAILLFVLSNSHSTWLTLLARS